MINSPDMMPKWFLKHLDAPFDLDDQEFQGDHMWGLNSHCFHIIDGHQPNSRGLYIHYKGFPVG